MLFLFCYLLLIVLICFYLQTWGINLKWKLFPVVFIEMEMKAWLCCIEANNSISWCTAGLQRSLLQQQSEDQRWKKGGAANAPSLLIFHSCANFCVFFHAIFAYYVKFSEFLHYFERFFHIFCFSNLFRLEVVPVLFCWLK